MKIVQTHLSKIVQITLSKNGEQEMKVNKSKAMNDYVICVEESHQSSIVEMPEQTREAVKTGTVILTTDRGEQSLLEYLPEGTEIQKLTIYYRAAEGLMFPDDEKIAVPLKAIISVEVKE